MAGGVVPSGVTPRVRALHTVLGCCSDFGEFKQLLLQEKMISVGDGDGRYAVADGLVDIVTPLEVENL